MKNKQVTQEMTMETQVIQIRYNQGNPVVWCINKAGYKSDKEFKRAMSFFMNSVEKYYNSGKLLPLHYYFECPSENYVSLIGLRDITYMPLSVYQAMQQINKSESKTRSIKSKVKNNDNNESV